MAYCQEIGRKFWQQKSFLDNYQSRFVSIGHINVPKRKTRIERSTGNYDSPERMLKIDWPDYIEFNHLAGRK
ncbi:hypothetical protein MC7420_6974 [Coleofasciculus chthonoplastes PCC 7420]|uniref:Uncharacterized protein n=1 Tax=Coleofasciculus chthonoplastes PCC 7420 TaxID=118168 RepID=B4W1Z8_9CYAN|nr:hypothetical protein [Coleofasciculus chthonoplastes]EDX71888.1 hypothetical protein MC7420_6974 [Coleofasciculus chthonoplastes PCC 7420]